MRSAALRITTIYVLAGFIWISLSDRLLDHLRSKSNIDLMLFLNSAKGWFYVSITGLILYKLIRNYTAELAQSEQQYRSYFEEAPLPQWVIDRKTMLITAVNDQAALVYGFSKDEFLKMSALDVCKKTNINTCIMTFRELKPGMNHIGPAAHIIKDGRKITVELTAHLLKDGRNNYVLVTAQPIKS